MFFMIIPWFAFAQSMVEKNSSKLFKDIEDFSRAVGRSFGDEVTINTFATDGVHIVFWIIILACFVSSFWFLKELGRVSRRKKRNFPSLISNILPEAAAFVFSCGVAIYFLGYAYGGTAGNWMTLTLRAALSSFEMFLSKSNLIGIADNCKSDSLYMFFFAFFHASAVMISMAFAVTCFGKRIMDWMRGLVWCYSPSKPVLNVFWGFNEKSILLAKDIYTKTNGKERIVFIDLPQGDDDGRVGQSFSGILGLLSYKTNIAKQISDMKYLLLRSSMSLASIDTVNKEILQEMNIGKLDKFMKVAGTVNFFVFTNDEVLNLRSALNLLDSKIGKNIDCLYCSGRKTKVTSLQEECQKDGKLRLIDDSKESVMELAMRKNAGGGYYAHPINFVTVNTQLGYVDSSFTSLIIGFGTTGQDMLRFLYEFSAFPDSNGKKAPVKFFVCDSKVDETKGNLYQEIPALPHLEACGEIEFLPYNIGTNMFYEKILSIIEQLNYVVIATGDDSRNLHIAAMMYELALQHRILEFCNFKIFVRLYESENEYMFQKTIDAYTIGNIQIIEYFGGPRDIYTKQWIVDDEEGGLSDKFYKSYCSVSKSSYLPHRERRKKEIESENIKILGFRKLNRKLMQDRANCKHCYTKEVLLGLYNKAEIPELPKWPLQAGVISPKEQGYWNQKLMNASICEHLRWNASHVMMGYMPMSIEEVTVGCTCNEKTKKHLCIADWNDLPQKPDYKEYDYMVVLTTINLYYETKR